jgi:hypothetical protein
MTNWVRAALRWLGVGGRPDRREDAPVERRRHPRFVVRYRRVLEVATQSEGAAAAADGQTIALVRGSTAPKWLMLLCPCGCGEVRRVSVSAAVQPSWRLTISWRGRVSLYPSVWLMGECRAHFVLRDNRALVL